MFLFFIYRERQCNMYCLFCFIKAFYFFPFLSFIEIIFSLPHDILFAFILLIYYNDDRLLYR